MKISSTRISFAAVTGLPDDVESYIGGKEPTYTYRDGLSFSYNLFDPDAMLREAKEELEVAQADEDVEKMEEFQNIIKGLEKLVETCDEEGVRYITI